MMTSSSALEIEVPESVTVSPPAWFPASRSNSSSTEPGSGTSRGSAACGGSASVVTVLVSTYRHFSMLNNDEMKWFYRSAFRMMHNRLKRTIPSLPPCVSYSMFTPPWLRPTLVTSDASAKATLDEVTIPDLRAHASTYGRRRITLLLAAFYEHEPDMCRTLMDWLYVNRKLLVERYRAKASGTAAAVGGGAARANAPPQQQERRKKERVQAPPAGAKGHGDATTANGVAGCSTAGNISVTAGGGGGGVTGGQQQAHLQQQQGAKVMGGNSRKRQRAVVEKTGNG